MTSTGGVFKISYEGNQSERRGGYFMNQQNFGQTRIMFRRLTPQKTIIHHAKVKVKTLKYQNSNHSNLKTSVFNYRKPLNH